LGFLISSFRKSNTLKLVLRGYGTLKYGDVHEKFNFLEIPDLRPLRTGQKNSETILPNFFEMSVKFQESTQWYKFYHVATAITTTVCYKNMTKYSLVLTNMNETI